MGVPVVSVSIDDSNLSESLQKIADRISGRFRVANDEYSKVIVDEVADMDKKDFIRLGSSVKGHDYFFEVVEESKGVEMEVEEVFSVDGTLYRKLAGDEVTLKEDKYHDYDLFKNTSHIGIQASAILPDKNTFYAREVVISSSDYRELDVGEWKRAEDEYLFLNVWACPAPSMLKDQITKSTAPYRRKFKLNKDTEEKSIKNHIEEAVDNVVNAEPYTMVMCGCKMHSFKSTDDPYKEHRNFQWKNEVANEGSIFSKGHVRYENGIGISASKRTVRMDDQYEA